MLLFPNAVLGQTSEKVVITSCYDGDTCTSSTGEKIRLACIDTPELRGKRADPVPAKEARDYLRELVVGRKVTIRRITTDRYGRTVAELFNNRGNVNQLMVKSGQAFAYRKYLRQCDIQKYLFLESEAQLNGSGVWSVGQAGIRRPWDYRSERRSGSSNSGLRRKYRCQDIGSWQRAQQLLRKGHLYLDSDGDGEACESLR